MIVLKGGFMSMPYPIRAGSRAQRYAVVIALCLWVFSLGACVRSGPGSGAEPGNPDEKRFAYDLAMNVPANWTVVNSLGADAVPKAALDARRKQGAPVPLFELSGTPGARGLQPSIACFLVNEEGVFIPREYMEKLSPEEFAVMAKEMIKKEKSMAKKNKTRNTLLDMQFSRDSVGGNLALMHRMLTTGPDGKPVHLLGWDIYLQNGAGLTVRCAYDPEVPGVENNVTSIVKSLSMRTSSVKKEE
jgi:hypothetical protein